MSDTIEALIGAAFLSLGGAAALQLASRTSPSEHSVPEPGSEQLQGSPRSGLGQQGGGNCIDSCLRSATTNSSQLGPMQAVEGKAQGEGQGVGRAPEESRVGEQATTRVGLRLWNHAALARALMATALTVSKLLILPDSYDTLVSASRGASMFMCACKHR